MTLANPSTHTTAIVTALQAAGLVVGDAAPPTVSYGAQTPQTFTGYVVVYPLTETFDGSLGGPFDDADFTWQVTCVADTRAACDALVHAVNAALIGQTLTVAGRTVPQIRPVEGAPLTRREDDPPPAQTYRYVATPQYAAWSH